MNKQDDKPNCSECGATVPYTPTPNFGYTFQVDTQPAKYYCDEKCLVANLKGMIDESTAKSILRAKSQGN